MSNTVLSIELFDTGRADGEGKTRNETPGQVHRAMITNRNNGLFRIDVKMETCIHGEWAKDDPTPASFMVFQCEVNSLEEYRVRKLKLRWEFVNGEGTPGQEPANPAIEALGPHLTRRYNRSLVNHQVEKEGEVGLEGAEAAPIKPVAKMRLNFSKEFEKHYYEEVQAMADPPDGNTQRRTRAEWLFKQNSQLNEGIVPAFRVAVLLKRKTNAPFQGLFTLTEFDAGFRYKLAESWDDFYHSREPNVDDPVNFVPGKDDVGDRDLIKEVKHSLGQLKSETGGVDQQHAWLWLVDAGDEPSG